ncbi:MAG: transposase [Nitrospinota bacterium]|nr:transposase [Nitrospinota bacterium]
MSRKGFTAEQIIHKLRQAEVGLANGQRMAQVCKTLGISEQTYYRGRREYAGRPRHQAKRLKTREQENARLKKLVAEQALGNAILKEASQGNF